MIVGGQTLQVPGTGVVVVASKTLSAGGSAATASGSVYSVDSAGSLVVAVAPGTAAGSGSAAGAGMTGIVTPVGVTSVQVVTASGKTFTVGASGVASASGFGAVGGSTTVRGATPTISAFQGAGSAMQRSWSFLGCFLFLAMVLGIWL